MKGNRKEVRGLDLSSCSRVLLVKVSHQIWCMHVVQRFPGVVFNPEVLLFYKVFEFPVDDFAIKDLLYHPFFLIINYLWEQERWGLPTHDQVNRGQCQFDYVEYQVKAFHGQG